LTSTTVALLQISAFGTDQLKNHAKGIQYCLQAAQLGADIALFPEMWNIGYTSFDPDRPGARQAWFDLAIDRQSEFITAYQTLASQIPSSSLTKVKSSLQSLCSQKMIFHTSTSG